VLSEDFHGQKINGGASEVEWLRLVAAWRRGPLVVGQHHDNENKAQRG
jgi:hypothetical protein